MSLTLAHRREYGAALLLVLIASLILFTPFLSGDRVYVFFGDANDDTFQSYVPAYQAAIEKIRDRDFSLMDFTWCAGESLLGEQFTFFDPFALLVYAAGLAFGSASVPRVLIWVQIFRILAAAAACIYFLGCFQLKSTGRVTASVCYALCSYMVGGIGQHYMFATAPVLFALLLAFLEKSTRNPKYLPMFTVCTAIVGIWSVYFCYMMLLACGLYAIVRFFMCTDRITWKAIAMWFCPLLAGVVIGIMISAVVFLPTAYIMLFSSSRMSYRQALFTLKPVQQIVTTFLRLFSEQTEGTMNSWSGWQTHFNSPHLFFSGFLLAAVPQYLLSFPHMEKGERIAAVVAAGLLGVAFVFPAVGIAFNAFTYHMARYTFIFLPLFAVMIAKTITNAQEAHFFSFVGAAITVGALLAAMLLYGMVPDAAKEETKKATLFGFCAVLAAVGCLYFLAHGEVHWKRFGAAVCALAVFAGVLLDDWTSTYVKRGILAGESVDWIYQNKGIEWISRLHEENSTMLYRTERVLTGWGSWPMFSSSLAFEYCSVTGYDSVINENMVGFCNLFGKGISGDALSGVGSNVAYAYGQIGRTFDWCMADLLGIRYILSSYPTNEPEWRLVRDSNSYGTELMYENPRIHTIGAVFYGWYPETELSNSADINQRMLPFAVSLDKAVSSVPRVTQPDVRTTDVYTGSVVLSAQSNIENCWELSLGSFEHQKDERTWLSFRLKGQTGTSVTCAVDTGFGFDPHNWSNGTYTLSGGEETVYLPLPNDIQKIGFFVDDTLENDAEVLDIKLVTTAGKNYSTEGINIHSPQQSGELYGTVEVNQTGILVIPIFIQDGWHMEVDGQEREIRRANRFLCAAELEAGTHSIRMWYETPWGNLGKLTSAVGVTAFAIMVFLIRKRCKKSTLL